MEYQLIRSRRRSLELRVSEEGQVVVRAPLSLAASEIERFVSARGPWVERQRERLAALPRPRPRWRHGEGCRHLGEALTLHVSVASRVRVWQSGSRLCVAVPDPENELQVRDAVRAWWRSCARGLCQERIERQFGWFAERGHALPVLRLKWMRSRWGSLSRRGYINLNLALMQYPLTVIDYVIMHELCHLEHWHHGPAFHALMDQRLPDWRERKRRLEAAG